MSYQTHKKKIRKVSTLFDSAREPKFNHGLRLLQFLCFFTGETRKNPSASSIYTEIEETVQDKLVEVTRTKEVIHEYLGMPCTYFFCSGNSIWLLCAYAPSTQKTYF